MPLSARMGRDVLVAPLLTNAEWERLRGNPDLTTTCCVLRAVAKTSPLGTRFFAHYPGADCPYHEESSEHLYGKAVLAIAADRAGYQVTTEARGQTPDGRVWIADVLAVRGNVRVALEVQWSPLSNDDLRDRQRAYRESDVRGIWFRRVGARLDEEANPCFRISYKAENWAFTVTDFGDKALGNFAKAALQSKLRWERYVEHAYLLAPTQCRNDKCGKTLHILVGEEFAKVDGTRLGYQFVDREGLEEAKQLVSGRAWHAAGAGRLYKRVATSVISARCSSCPWIFGPIHRKALYDEAVADDFRQMRRVPSMKPVPAQFGQPGALVGQWRLAYEGDQSSSDGLRTADRHSDHRIRGLRPRGPAPGSHG